MKQMVPSLKELFDWNGYSPENLRWVTLLSTNASFSIVDIQVKTGQ